MAADARRVDRRRRVRTPSRTWYVAARLRDRRPQLAGARRRDRRGRAPRRHGRVLRGEDPARRRVRRCPAEAVTARKQQRLAAARPPVARRAPGAGRRDLRFDVASVRAGRARRLDRRRARSRVLTGRLALLIGACGRSGGAARTASSPCASAGGRSGAARARRPRGPRRAGSRGRSRGSGTSSPLGTAGRGGRLRRRRPAVVVGPVVGPVRRHRGTRPTATSSATIAERERRR